MVALTRLEFYRIFQPSLVGAILVEECLPEWAAMTGLTEQEEAEGWITRLQVNE